MLTLSLQTAAHAAHRLATPPWAVRAQFACCLAAALLSACASSPPPAPAAPPAVVAAPAPAPAPAEPPAPAPEPIAIASPGAAALNDGLTAFQSGEYRRAEVRLTESQKLGLHTPDEQLLAYKTQAFLYCITKRMALCEKAFQSAFSVSSTFDLTRAERGHPVWGPVFAKVQKKQAAR